jgi:hypothetical protein
MRDQFTMTGIRNITYAPSLNFQASAVNLCKPDDATRPAAALIVLKLCGVIREKADPRHGNAEYLMYTQEVFTCDSVPQVRAGKRPTGDDFKAVTDMEQHPQHGCVLIPAAVLRAHADIWGKMDGGIDTLCIHREEIVPLVMRWGAIDMSAARGYFTTSKMEMVFTPLGMWEDNYADLLVNGPRPPDEVVQQLDELMQMIGKLMGGEVDLASMTNDSLSSVMEEVRVAVMMGMLLQHTEKDAAGVSIMRLFSGGISLVPPHPRLATHLVEDTLAAIKRDMPDWGDHANPNTLYATSGDDALHHIAHNVPFALSGMLFDAYTMPSVQEVDASDVPVQGSVSVCEVEDKRDAPEPDPTPESEPEPMPNMSEQEELASLKETWGAVWDE